MKYNCFGDTFDDLLDVLFGDKSCAPVGELRGDLVDVLCGDLVGDLCGDLVGVQMSGTGVRLEAGLTGVISADVGLVGVNSDDISKLRVSKLRSSNPSWSRRPVISETSSSCKC